MYKLINILFIALILSSCSESDDIVAENSSESILVGAVYFNGWWEESPNKWETGGVDWRADYPERIPLLGEYNTQETMDAEIAAAAQYGIDYFNILYYFGKNATLPQDVFQLQYLNEGLEHFMNSPNSDKMQFMIEITNHAPFALKSTEDWDEFMDVAIEAMKHPSYLKIDGRVVLKIHSAHMLYHDLGADIEACDNLLAHLKERALNEGAGELIITVGTNGKESIKAGHTWTQITEIDGTGEYMGVPTFPQQVELYPFEDLTQEAQDIRLVRKFDALNYVPYFPAGWDPRPWKDPRASFENASREQWKTALEALKYDLLRYANLGFPKKDGTTQKAFTMYAWNEFGEGGIIAPTAGDQYMKLEVIKEVFGE